MSNRFELNVATRTRPATQWSQGFTHYCRVIIPESMTEEEAKGEANKIAAMFRRAFDCDCTLTIRELGGRSYPVNA